MLAPVVTAPQAFPIKVSVRAHQATEHDTPLFSLNATVYFEHSGGQSVMLPAHRMWARADFETSHFASHLPPIDMPISHYGGETPYEPFGIQQTRDGVVVSGPGSLQVGGVGDIEAENLDLLRQVTPLQVRLTFGVAGMDRRVELLATLYRTTPAASQMTSWEFEESAMNPWSDLPAP